MGKDSKADALGSNQKTSVPNGDISTGGPKSVSSGPKSVSGGNKPASAGHTPVQKHRSVVSLPLQPENTPKRDSSVFDMIAGTKSKYEGCSNMNATSFITFFTHIMLRQNVIHF